MLEEMPPGPRGVRILSFGTTFAILGEHICSITGQRLVRHNVVQSWFARQRTDRLDSVLCAGTGVIVYWVVGFFGASRFGNSDDNTGNILQSPLGGNGKAQGALNIIYTVYLILSTPPFEYVARHSMLKVSPLLHEWLSTCNLWFHAALSQDLAYVSGCSGGPLLRRGTAS